MGMKNDLEETVIAAMMCNQPVILVEGQDDIKFYDNIATLEGLSVGVILKDVNRYVMQWMRLKH